MRNKPTPLCPAHYAGKVTPWDLEMCMTSSGDTFIDARRTDAIEYCFRMKEDLRGDLVKARHCIDAAIAHMDKKTSLKLAKDSNHTKNSHSARS